MSTSYRKRAWSEEVGEGTETVSGAKQLELWAMDLRDRAHVTPEESDKAAAEIGAGILAVGSEIVEQLTQIGVSLEVMLETGDYRVNPGVTSGVVAGTNCQPKEGE